MDANLQQAVQDLALIRKAIEQGDPRAETKRTGVVTTAHLMLQAIGLGLALFLIVFEYFFANNEMSYALAASKWDRNLGVEGLAEVALCMPFLLAALYFVVWRSAKHADRDLGEFLAKNFQYLRNLNFLSDLFVKFVVLSLAVLSLHGEWVPALLLLFCGDYLLQGRFFSLPLPLALVLGPVCFAGAGVMYLKNSTNLLVPLIVFALLCSISMAHSYLRGRAQ